MSAATGRNKDSYKNDARFWSTEYNKSELRYRTNNNNNTTRNSPKYSSQIKKGVNLSSKLYNHEEETNFYKERLERIGNKFSNKINNNNALTQQLFSSRAANPRITNINCNKRTVITSYREASTFFSGRR